ncbi:MAG TPA: hypothetical protein PLG43_12020 [Spirochaetia bacterium]|nr:hypothetical protein [Spirochaetia bacterium]
MEKIKVKVCVATNCNFVGSESLIEMLEACTDLADFIDIEAVHCM